MSSSHAGWSAGLGILVLLGIPARAQAPVYTVEGIFGDNSFGQYLAALGDVDGDGSCDFAVGDPYYKTDIGGGFYVWHGRVQVVSGKSGAQIYEYVGEPYSTLGPVAGLGDVDGDTVPDFAMGNDGEDVGGLSVGTVRVVSGATGGVLRTIVGQEEFASFGEAVASAGDVDADGINDLIVGAPRAQGYLGQAFVFSGATGAQLHVFTGVQPPSSAPVADFGGSLAGVGDVDLDGRGDVAVGAFAESPGGGFEHEGSIRVYSGRTGELLWMQFGDPYWHLGISIAVIANGTASKAPTIAIGAAGISGQPGFARIVAGGDGSVIATLAGTQSQSYFGTAITALSDYDLDGVDDLAIGAPFEAAPSGLGVVHVVSGSDFSTLASIASTVYSSLGSALAGLGDLNGDGIADLVAGSPINNNLFPQGYAKVFLGGWPAPATYCTAKESSQGCTPEIEASGAPSLTVGDLFRVRASLVINNQVGILAWSAAADAKPFFGGTLCLGAPVIRTAGQTSGGSAPPAADCTGSFDFHFSQAYMAQFLISAGATLHGQYWYRDPYHPDGLGVGLSDALSFVVIP